MKLSQETNDKEFSLPKLKQKATAPEKNNRLFCKNNPVVYTSLQISKLNLKS